MIKILREELYEKIWNKPVTHIAKEYGVSDSAIIKICKKMNIPRPTAGHWAKIKSGQVVKKVKLPKASKSGVDEYSLVGAHKSLGDKTKDEMNLHPLIQYEMEKKNKISVCENDSDRHTLYLRNRKSFNNASMNEKQILIPKAKIHFNLSVTKNTLSRALLIMDALAKAFEHRGWDLQCINDSGLKMQVIALDEKIEFSISEKIRQVDHVLTSQEQKEKKERKYYWGPKWDSVPSGLLTLKITGKEWLIARHSWNDGKIQRVESCLNSFCIGVIELAEAIKIDREKRKANEIKQEEERMQRASLRELREAELKKRELFEKQVDAWEKAESLRGFIKAVVELDANVLNLDGNDASKSEWIEWAQNYTNYIDPLKKAVPTIVEETEGMYLSSW